MKRNKHVLIDGSWFVRASTSVLTQEWTSVDVPALLSSITAAVGDHDTVHWFDATRYDREPFAIHADLARQPNVELTLKELRRHRGGGSWTQKQVDSAIVVGLIDQAEAGHDIVLVAADEDLVPGVEAARARGAHVTLASVPGDEAKATGVAATMLGQACDDVVALDTDLLASAVKVRAPERVAVMASIAAACRG